jgi:RNA recognition motif-containing protein
VAKRIYVGGLPYSVDETQLESLFGQYGQVTEASIISDRFTGQSRGFGFVAMENDDDAQKAISALNGTELGGRTLTVNEAKEREAGGRGGGGGGGYGGGGGGRRGGGGGYGDRERW